MVFAKYFQRSSGALVAAQSDGINFLYISMYRWKKQINFKTQRSLYSSVLLGTNI